MFPQRSIHPDHGQLDQVRSTALDGRIQCDPLRTLTHIEVAAGQLRDIALSAKQSFSIADLPCIGNHILHIAADTRIIGKVILNIFLGLIAADTDVICQGEFGNAVDDAEIDCLGMAALQGCDRLRLHAEDLGP